MAETPNVISITRANTLGDGQYTAVSVTEEDMTTSLLELSEYDVGNQSGAQIDAVSDPTYPIDATRPNEGYRFPRTKIADQLEAICCTFDIIRQFPWLHYDAAKDKLFCHACIRAVKKGKVEFVEDELLTTGFSDWPNAPAKLWQHKVRDIHRMAKPLPPPEPPSTPHNDSISVPTRKSLRKKPRHNLKWKVAISRDQGVSVKPQLVGTPKIISIENANKKTQLPVRCIHPSVAYMIKLVKSKPEIYQHLRSRSNIIRWRGTGKLMHEAGYAEFKRGLVCRKFFKNLILLFIRMRASYIRKLTKAKDPRKIRKPARASYCKMLWVLPYLEAHITQRAGGYDMTKLDAEQAKDITDEDLEEPPDSSDTSTGQKKVYEKVVVPVVQPDQPRQPYASRMVPLDASTTALELLSYQLQLLDGDQRREFELAASKLYWDMFPKLKETGLTLPEKYSVVYTVTGVPPAFPLIHNTIALSSVGTHVHAVVVPLTQRTVT